MEEVEELVEHDMELDLPQKVEEVEKSPPLMHHPSFKPKLIEILKNLHSKEVVIYSEASKEFVKLLKGASGGDILREYIHLSPKCSEILESWKLHQGNPGMAYILSLVSVVLEHPVGKSWDSEIFKNVNNLAHLVFTEKLDDVYRELNSGEYRRQNAALGLVASIVRRGVGLASEVARGFDFKLPGIVKLCGVQKKVRKVGGKEVKQGMRRSSTRQAFVRFAMSFIEVGNARLLRWILQKREVYSCVLRGIESDDVETVVYVLSTLRDKVLTEDSLVGTGLRSVLFGSVTLEQLSNVSGNLMAGDAADLAHRVLVMVCTDPSNGLMPSLSLNLKGNEKRLFDLMKKLKAAEIRYHKELLLAIVRGRPSLCSAYLDEFPYNLKPRSSSLHITVFSNSHDFCRFSAISLMADMISSINFDSWIGSLTAHSHIQTTGNPDLQNMLKCIIPRAFARSVISIGLQYECNLVKHGTLRIVFESLKSLSGLIQAIDSMLESTKSLDTDKPGTHNWVSLKQFIQDEVRSSLPEPQVLLKLLSSSNNTQSKIFGAGLKRCADFPGTGLKKVKPNDASDDADIIIGGIHVEDTKTSDDPDESHAETNEEQLDVKNDDMVLAEIWSLSDRTLIGDELNSVDNFFQARLLDVFTFYLRVVPIAIEGSFDFFKILPINHLSLSIDQLQSLMSLLLECIGQAPGGRISARAPKLMYKHLQRIMNILVYSQVKGIRDQAYVLARAAMISTGAFDQNLSEVDAWLISLPGYFLRSYAVDFVEQETIHGMSEIISSFLCDAVSTVGNNLYKYLGQMQVLLSKLDSTADYSPRFSPLIICAIEKCLLLLESESKAYKVYEKSMVSLYVCNTISLILQIQVDAQTLSGLIHLVLNEKFNKYSSADMDLQGSLCEWWPVRNLSCYARDIFNRNSFYLSLTSATAIKGYDCSFSSVLIKITELLKREHGVKPVGVSLAFTSSIVCATPDDILTNFPLLLTVTQQYFTTHLPFLSWVLYLEGSFLPNVVEFFQNMLFLDPQMIEQMDYGGSKYAGTSDCLDSLQPDSSSANFGLFLYRAPFYALFSAVMNFGRVKLDPECSSKVLDILHSNTLLNLLRLRVSEGSLDDCILSLRIVLFWTYQTISSYETCQSDILTELFKMFIILVRYILHHILELTSGASSFSHHAQEVIDLISQHPILIWSLSKPLCFSKKLLNKTLGDNVDDFQTSIDPIDSNILEFLRVVFDFAFSVGKRSNYTIEIHDSLCGLILRSIENFEMSIVDNDVEQLLPNLYMLLSLKKFVSPFELLEFVDRMFHKLKNMVSAVSIGLYIAEDAMGRIFSYLQQPNVDSDWFWDRKARSFNVSIIENLYHKILEFGISFNLQIADVCLLRIVSAVHNQRLAKPDPALVPLYAGVSKMITNSPMKLLIHCFYPTSKIKGKLLLRLIEVSPTHLHLFGKAFLGILNKDSSVLGQLDKDKDLSNDEYVLLLPAALSYLITMLHKYGKQELQPLQTIPKFYSSILLKGFSNWKDYVSKDIFQEEYESVPRSIEGFHNFCSSTLLGKAVIMLRYFFIQSGSSVEKLNILRIFDSMHLHASLFNDPQVSKLGNLGYRDSLKTVVVVAAKLSFTRLLLFPPQGLVESSTMESNGKSNLKKSKGLKDAKTRFMILLVNTLDNIVRQFPLKYDSSGDSFCVFRYLEHHILCNIVQLSSETKNTVCQSLDQFIRSSFDYRFGDPLTLRAIRSILVSTSEVTYSSKVMTLLVENPKFVPTLLGRHAHSNSSTFIPNGLLQPVPSIFKSIHIMHVDQSSPEDIKLEVVKLLRVLYNLRSSEQIVGSVNGDRMSSREMLSLLLSGYSATRNEVDLEIFQLMREIEITEGPYCGSIADKDYLWGESALKFKKEQLLDGDCETFERRKIFFRENVPVDSKLSVMTILQLCSDRSSSTAPVSPKALVEDEFLDGSEKKSSSKMNIVQTYDTAFILQFSNHCLSMEYLEPTEFSRLGLLAITFVSISSHDDELRKLAYDCLGKFKKSLENYQKRKDILQLQLLLTYIQNGITKEWQRIPSVVAVFAAEASLVLLDPSQHHFLTLSEFLMHSNRMNLEIIPLFPKLLRSSSIHFKTDRLWILQLLYVGLNSNDDVKIYKKQKVLNGLLSFCASSLSDPESKILILQIMKKYAAIDPSLIKDHGLIPWLSSILLYNQDELVGEHKELSLQVIEFVLKVISDWVSSEMISTWLQDCALEQLSELSSHLHSLVVSSLKLLKGNIPVVNSLLCVIVSTLEISQKRSINRPHFTLSLTGLFRLYEAIDTELSNPGTGSTSLIALNIILNCPPIPVATHMDKARLSKLLTLAVPAALQQSSARRSVPNDPIQDLLSFKEHTGEESLVSKLLRWATSSVILGNIADKSSKLYSFISSSSLKIETLQPIVEEIIKMECDSKEIDSTANERLAILLLFLQQLSGTNRSILPSVILAICLLLLGKSSTSPGCIALNGSSDAIASYCSKIYYPPEVNPAWTWSCAQPWKEDCSLSQTEREQMEEEQACQSILIIFSNALEVNSSSSSVLSHKDVENFGLYEWERDTLLES